MPITSIDPSKSFHPTFTSVLTKKIPVLNGNNIYVIDYQSDEDLDGKDLRMNLSVTMGSKDCLSPVISGLKTLARQTRWLRILWYVLGSIAGIVVLLLLVKLILNAMAARRENAASLADTGNDADAVAKITVVEGPDLGLVFPISSDVITIGRGSDMDLTLADPTVSRYHCQLIARDRVFEIKLTEGKSGIMLNGLQVPKGNLKVGDIITLGQTRLEFKLL